MAAIISLLDGAKILKKPLDDIYELGKSNFKDALAKWENAKHINTLYEKIRSIQKVKTIWQIDREVNLMRFYYPSKLIIGTIDPDRDNRFEETIETKLIDQIDQIPGKSNAILQGTAGQGKSIFLRYLCSQELRRGSKIPIFFELRKIQKEKTLKHHLFEILDAWGFEINEELFDFFAGTGKFIFLLDGFDEIEPSLVKDIITELELISEKYANLQIIITSRPDSGIERSTFFRVYHLAPLTERDHEGILNKLLDGDDKQAQTILDALKDSSTEIKQLLTTPLLMTLLVISYKAEQKIPEQFSDFYEHLFQTLLSRHDKSKPGYIRPKKSSLNERKMQEFFEAFCFLASKKAITTMSYDEIHSLAEDAVKLSTIKCDANSFIEDVSKIACLVVKEGWNFHFIHKSVREYHAAIFIARRPDDFAKSFYNAMLQGKWDIWRQELFFLSQVDKYRFSKYFAIPHIEITFDAILTDDSDNYKALGISLFDKVTNDNLMRFTDNPVSLESMTQLTGNDFFNHIDNFETALFRLMVNHENRFGINKTEFYKKATPIESNKQKLLELISIDVINILNLGPSVSALAKNEGRILYSYYHELKKFIKDEEDKTSIIDF